MRNVSRAARALLLTIGILAPAAQGATRDWPAKSVRIIVPFPHRGDTDILGRQLGQLFSKSLGRKILIENRPGKRGLSGASLATRSSEDGYTYLLTCTSISINATLHRRLFEFDPLKDLQPVSWLSSVPLVLTVTPGLPVRDVTTFIALGRRSDRPLNAASDGFGTISHLAIELLNQVAGVGVTHVPFTGKRAASTAVAAAELDFMFQMAATIQPQVKAGKLRPLAVTGAGQSSAFPGLPTMDSIYPGFVVENRHSLFAPVGTPQAIIARVHAEILKAMRSEEMRNLIASWGAVLVASTPEELSAMLRSEVERYATLIRERNLSTD